jgi:hypothetical protein
MVQGLYEEKATLLGRIGRHDQVHWRDSVTTSHVCKALSIYVSNLKNMQMAEDYCMRMYDRDKETTRDVYLALLKVRYSFNAMKIYFPIRST